MAIQIQNFPEKNFGPPTFTVNCSTGWTSNELQISQYLSKSKSFKPQSPPQLHHEAKHLGLRVPDQDASSTMSLGQSHNEICAMGGTNSQDQSMSSESGQDESCGNSMEGKMKPVLLLRPPNISFNHAQTEYGQSMARCPSHYADPYFGGLFTPYGPQSLMVGITTTRVPLPLNLDDDGPTYVNAKQYHGILRRRQSRAKLEAQNKLLKTRKPYLHESRHRHALNRVRGSGGRFLSTKKLQQTVSTPITSSHATSRTIYLNRKDSFGPEMLCSGSSRPGASSTTCSDITNISNSDVLFRQPDRGFSAVSGSIHGVQHGWQLMRG